MLSVAEAQSIILQLVRPLVAQNLPLSPGVLGLVLGEDVASDLDMPPHNKALMDGYAVRVADLPEGRAALVVIEEITAGRTPRHSVGPGQAARIMTGAPIPAGADAVVVVERTRMIDDGRVQIEDRAPQPQQNIMAQGREMRRGETVLTPGTLLRPQELGVLATVGRTTVRLIPAPRVAVLSTGDEVVDAAQMPGPGQIRNGNGPMLAAQVARAGGVPHFLGIARDRVEHLRSLAEEGLKADALVLSGGVSAGKLDLVPGVLQELGVRPHFHKVEMKPGKPMYFGTRPRPNGPGDTLVFGLPGNPVSSLVCFELFVKPALRALAGHPEPGPRLLRATLAEDFPHRSDRPTYYPASLQGADKGWRVAPVPWLGSADLRGLTQANALMLLPAGDHHHRAGQELSVLPLDLW